MKGSGTDKKIIVAFVMGMVRERTSRKSKSVNKSGQRTSRRRIK